MAHSFVLSVLFDYRVLFVGRKFRIIQGKLGFKYFTLSKDLLSRCNISVQIESDVAIVAGDPCLFRILTAHDLIECNSLAFHPVGCSSDDDMVKQEMREDHCNTGEVSTSEVESNPEKVLAKGYGLSTGLAGQPNIFTLDARQAGFGDFDVVIKGASRATIEYLEEEDALYKIKYYVTLPGDYQIEIKYDQQHIPGSPFPANVMDPSVSDYEKSSTTSLESVSHSTVSEEESSLSMKKLAIDAQIISPSGDMLSGKVFRTKNGKVSVKFPREEVGTYVVSLRNRKNGEMLPGCPYEVKVNTRKLNATTTAHGQGLKIATINDANNFTITAKNGLQIAELCIAVVGNSFVKIQVFQNNSDSVDVLYDVKRPGIYTIHMHENEDDIMNSPFQVKTAQKCENTKSTDPICTKAITLWHGCDTLASTVTTKIKSPDGRYLAHAVARRSRHLLEIRFLPNMNGEYLLNLNPPDINNAQQQSFKLLVTNYPSNEEIFRVTGDGMHTAKVNEQTVLFIDSLLPVSRSFAVGFDGPDKVDIIQSRKKSGRYQIAYTTRRQGHYLMSLKYDGFHVGGSPFHIKTIYNRLSLPPTIETSVDDFVEGIHACRAYGEGLNRAFAGVLNTFTVDALNAGSGALMAGFDKNNTQTEIVCKHVGNCVYDVQYKVVEAGNYKLSVLWAGSHIGGSPFLVHVKDENNNVSQ